MTRCWLILALAAFACGPGGGAAVDDRCDRECLDSSGCRSNEFCSPVDHFCHPQGQDPRVCEPLSCVMDTACTTSTGTAGTCACGLCTYVDATCPGTGRRYTSSGEADFSGACVAGATRVESAAFHTCAVTTSGTVACWGQNCSGQLGDHDATGCDFNVTPPKLTFSATPVTVLDAPAGSPITNVVNVTTGAAHTCVVKADTTVWCWGDNAKGQLGNGTSGSISYSPVQVIDDSDQPLIDVVSLASGFFFTCALTSAGTVRCWGENRYGALGNGTVANDTSLPPVPKATTILPPTSGPTPRYRAITAGAHFACALTTAPNAAEERMVCWGRNQLGQLGNNGFCGHLTECENRGAPELVLFSTEAPTATASGCACAGANGVAIVPSPPAELPAPFVVEAGNHHVCVSARFPDAVYCSGQDLNAANGTGLDGTTRFVASKVELPATPGLIIDVAAGSDFGCALADTGQLSCWGGNAFGQLGRGDTAGPALTPVATIADLDAVTAGFNHACAVRDGRVLCWGQNNQGQLGDGTTANRADPVEVQLDVCPAR